MSKIVENTYRDVNIAFVNELFKIYGNTGVDIWEVIKLYNKHPRINIINRVQSYNDTLKLISLDIPHPHII